MDYLRVRSILLCLIILACFSCGGRSDPTSTSQDATVYGGKLTLGTGLANTTPSDANKLKVCDVVNSEVYGLFVRTLREITATTQVMDSLPVMRIIGSYSGYAMVQGSKTLRPGTRTLDYDFQFTLYDYSDTGLLFMGGSPSAEGYVISDEDGEIYRVRLILNGALAFAGKYKGAMEYEYFRLPINTCNELTSAEARERELREFDWTGNQTLLYGDTRFHFNPYIKMLNPDDTIPPVCPNY